MLVRLHRHRLILGPLHLTRGDLLQIVLGKGLGGDNEATAGTVGGDATLVPSDFDVVGLLGFDELIDGSADHYCCCGLVHNDESLSGWNLPAKSGTP